MGLDMYLLARKYVGSWDHSSEEEKAAYKAISQAAGLGGFRCEGSPHLHVEICVAYWRKATQVHGWFVKNVQKGEDDCREYYCDREMLQQLLEECKAALKCKAEGVAVAEATATLPPQRGFFFGSTDIDEYYWQDLEDTVAQLSCVLTDSRLNDFSFAYRSSW